MDGLGGFGGGWGGTFLVVVFVVSAVDSAVEVRESNDEVCDNFHPCCRTFLGSGRCSTSWFGFEIPFFPELGW